MPGVGGAAAAEDVAEQARKHGRIGALLSPCEGAASPPLGAVAGGALSQTGGGQISQGRTSGGEAGRAQTSDVQGSSVLDAAAMVNLLRAIFLPVSMYLWLSLSLSVCRSIDRSIDLSICDVQS